VKLAERTRDVLFFFATLGACEAVDCYANRVEELDIWLGLFMACVCWALIVHLFYIEPKGKT
jgi:hypothetical protein